MFLDCEGLAYSLFHLSYQTYALDYFNGDPIPKEALHPVTPHELAPGYDLGKWLERHTQEVTRPIIDKVVSALKEQGITIFGATGYCFGGEKITGILG